MTRPKRTTPTGNESQAELARQYPESHPMNSVVQLESRRMTKRRAKHKPSEPRHIPDPAEAARRGVPPSSWGVNDEALRLKANADVDTQQGRDVEGKRRVRYDVFALLYYRPGAKLSTPAYDAVRRLQGDMAILHRTQGASDAIRTAGPAQTGALALVSDDFARGRVLAGERVSDALAGLKPWAANLLRSLCEHEIAPTAEIVSARPIPGKDENKRPIAPPAAPAPLPHWKALVRKHTEQKRPSQAGQTVCQAADALAESYRRLDNEPKGKAA